MGFVHTIKDWLVGGGENGGPADALLNVSPIGLGAAVLIGSSAALDGAAADGLAGASRMGGAAFTEFASNAFNMATDYLILRDDWRSYSSNSWQKAAVSHPELNEAVKNGLDSHALMLSQLKKLQGESPKLFEEYKALGMNLPKPDSDLLKNAFRYLGNKLHPDKSKAADANAVMAELNVANGHLHDPEIHKAYSEALEHNKPAMEEYFTQKSSFDWKDAFKYVGPQAQLGYNGTAVRPSSKAMQWIMERNGLEKTGLAFAVVGGVALLGYGMAKIADSKSKQSAAPHTARIEKNTAKTPTAASLG